MRGVRFLQANESFSRAGTVRGLHFQWNPYMGKLVRTIRGHMIDVALDIRKGSPTYGQIVAYDMPVQGDEDFAEWIWLPPGFAHGNTFPQDTVIEYFCSGEYSPGNEAGISPVADDLDWSLCDPALRDQFQSIARDDAADDRQGPPRARRWPGGPPMNDPGISSTMTSADSRPSRDRSTASPAPFGVDRHPGPQQGHHHSPVPRCLAGRNRRRSRSRNHRRRRRIVRPHPIGARRLRLPHPRHPQRNRPRVRRGLQRRRRGGHRRVPRPAEQRHHPHQPAGWPTSSPTPSPTPKRPSSA